MSYGGRRWVVKVGSPFQFFALLFVLSIPFWLFGAYLGSQILPGLPLSALMAVCPAAAAGILVLRSGGPSALKLLLYRIADCRRMRPWAWLVSLGTMPAVMTLSAVALTSLGHELPPFEISLAQTIALFAVFLVAAAAEELGWSAYATGDLVEKYGLITAGLIIGGVAVVWHLIPLLQVDRTWNWIAWWAVGTIARRLIIVWLYARGGQSVFSATLFHTMNNLCWMLFPVMGSHYDPVTSALILVALAAAIIAPVGNSQCRL